MKKDNLFALSVFWFAWEVHWGALLGAAIQGQVARFAPADFIGTATAIITGSGAAFSILAQYGAGRLSDKTGRRMPFIVIGTLLDILALFGFALSPSFLIVVLAFAGIQISLNTACGPYQALMPDKIEKTARGHASAYLGLFRLSGSAVGLLLGKLFVHQPGPHVTAAMFTGGLLHLAEIVSAILLVTLVITVLGVSDRQPVRATEGAVEAPWPERASFGWLIASRAAVSMGLYLILPYFAFYLRFAQHVPNYLDKSLTLLLIMTGCAIVGTVPAGMFGDRIPKKTIIFGAIVLLAIGAASLSLTARHHTRDRLGRLLLGGLGACVYVIAAGPGGCPDGNLEYRRIRSASRGPAPWRTACG
jgi:MFS family permease